MVGLGTSFESYDCVLCLEQLDLKIPYQKESMAEWPEDKIFGQSMMNLKIMGKDKNAIYGVI